MSDNKDRDKDGSGTPPLSSSSSSSSSGSQQAPSDVWNNPRLLRLDGEIDSVTADIKVKEGKLENLRREKRKASSPEDKADFQEEIDELKQSIADLKDEKNKVLEQRRELTQSLSGNTAFSMGTLQSALAPIMEHQATIMEHQATLENKVEQQNEFLNRIVPKKMVSQSDAEAGNQLYAKLKLHGKVEVFLGLDEEDPVLTTEEYKKHQTFANEAEYVEFISPFLKACLSDEKKGGVVLADSQNHAWLHTESHEPAHFRKPDLFLCDECVFSEKSSSPDSDAIPVGVLMDWDCADLVDGIGEAKTSPTTTGHSQISYKALSQVEIGLHHLFSSATCQTKNSSRMDGRAIAFYPRGFLLVSAFNGVVNNIVQAEWNQPGTKKLISNHFLVRSPWITALRSACSELKVTPVQKGFLGGGGTGRVFRVIGEEGGKKALKLVLGEENVSALTVERDVMSKLSEHCNVMPVEALFIPTVQTDCVYGSMLLAYVGCAADALDSPDYKAIFTSLRSIHQYGYCHGDARLSNIVLYKRVYYFVDFMGVPVFCEQNVKRDVHRLLESISNNNEATSFGDLCDDFDDVDSYAQAMSLRESI